MYLHLTYGKCYPAWQSHINTKSPKKVNLLVKLKWYTHLTARIMCNIQITDNFLILPDHKYN
jgi:hypothetical protein